MTTQMNVIDLFSGIGGFSLGFQRAGYEILAHSEVDAYACKVYHRHFPESKCLGDITKIDNWLDTSANLCYNLLSQEQKVVFDLVALKKNYDETVKMYESGLSIQNIADYYNISRQAMWEVLKKRGCKFRDNKRFGKENHFHRGTTASDKAQNLLEEALERGILQRKVVCEICHSTGTFKDGRTAIQAHHSDYNKPLDVMWLCQKCHHEWHKHNKAIPREEVMPSEVADKFDGIVVTGGFP